MTCILYPTSFKYKVELSSGNSAEFSQENNSQTIQSRAMKLTSLDSLGTCELIYVYFKPIKLVEI